MIVNKYFYRAVDYKFLIHSNECWTGVARSALTSGHDSALSTLIKLPCLRAKLKRKYYY